LVLPNFTQLIKIAKEKEAGKIKLDLSELKIVLDGNKDDIESVEVYVNKASVDVENIPEGATIKDI
jgi:predicted peroxiredoxin